MGPCPESKPSQRVDTGEGVSFSPRVFTKNKVGLQSLGGTHFVPVLGR